MNIISEEMLKKGQNKEAVSGVILVNSYNTALTKNGNEYITGQLQSGINIPFKAWGNTSAFTELKNNDYNNVPSYISGSFDTFGGTVSITIDSINAVDGFTPDMFFQIKYNADAYLDALKTLTFKRMTEKAQKYANKILFDNTEVLERFKVEFAASSHHDNCKSGLLAHTYKMCANMNHIFNLYPNIIKKANPENPSDFQDVCMLGALLHDIGKIDEMEFGVYQPISRVTHRYLGTEMISPYKDEIIKDYSEVWYYDLISIMLQHHGEYGDDCKTLCSFIVHEADNLDAKFTLIEQLLENPTEASAGKKIKVDSKVLNL